MKVDRTEVGRAPGADSHATGPNTFAAARPPVIAAARPPVSVPDSEYTYTDTDVEEEVEVSPSPPKKKQKDRVGHFWTKQARVKTHVRVSSFSLAHIGPCPQGILGGLGLSSQRFSYWSRFVLKAVSLERAPRSDRFVPTCCHRFAFKTASP